MFAVKITLDNQILIDHSQELDQDTAEEIVKLIWERLGGNVRCESEE